MYFANLNYESEKSTTHFNIEFICRLTLRSFGLYLVAPLHRHHPRRHILIPTHQNLATRSAIPTRIQTQITAGLNLTNLPKPSQMKWQS